MNDVAARASAGRENLRFTASCAYRRANEWAFHLAKEPAERQDLRVREGGGNLDAKQEKVANVADLEEAADAPVLQIACLDAPAIIEGLELRQNGEHYLVGVRAANGAEGVAVASKRAAYLYPLLQDLVFPYFLGKDARDLEDLIDGVYRYKSNYKLSGIAFWSCVAWVEFCLLDLLGKLAGRSIGELMGTVIRRDIPVYIASGRRETTPHEEVEILARRVKETGARAVKFKVGGRMSGNADSLPERSEQLIRLARQALGEKLTIHADANGSYDVPRAIEIGRLLEGISAHFYEEPCPFDCLEETREVARSLSIPIAAGEQETSLRRFRWMIENGAARVLQPDLHYFGGFIRTTRAARMAARAGLPVTVHISSGLGYLYMLHFASYHPQIGAFQEFKGDTDEAGGLFDPPLAIRDGLLRVPAGPGLGLTQGEELWREGKKVG